MFGRKRSKRVQEDEAKKRMLEDEMKQEQLAREREREESRLKEKRMLESEDEKETERRRGEVMERTEVSQTKVDFTQGSMCLVDKLEAHQAGTLMKYVVISNPAPPDREINLSRLRTYKAKNDIARVGLDRIEPFDLCKNYTDLSLINAIPFDALKSMKPYCLVSDIFIHYVPMDTFYTEAQTVDFFINDFRRVRNTAVRHYQLTHSAGYNVLFSLDYCMRTSDLKYLTLSISTNLDAFREGIAWGCVKVLISLMHLDFPIKANMQETMGVMHMSDSDLKEFISDPRGSDGVITNEALKMLKDSYQREEIENITKPRNDTKDINREATVVNMHNQSMAASEVIRNLRQNALALERQRNELPRSSPDGPTPKSILKSAQTESDMEELMIPLEGEMRPEDSQSNADSDPTIELPTLQSPPSTRKAVNFGM
jgi:hypothetical protein